MHSQTLQTLIRIVALFLACAPVLHGGNDDDKIDMSPFVPFIVTGDDEGYSPDEDKYLSRVLLAMNEPVLTAEGKSKEYYALRIIHDPSLAGHPVAIRIEKNGNQITRRSVKLRKVNSSSGPIIQEQKSESVSAETLAKIQDELKNAGIDALPLRDDVQGLDGNTFLIERIEDGKHTVFTRWTPEVRTSRRQLTKLFALADRLFQEAGFWEKNDIHEQIPFLEHLIARKIDFVVPDKTSDAENALSERFFNKPEERAFNSAKSMNWRDKWPLFADAIVAKAEHEKLDIVSLQRCISALNGGHNLHTALHPAPPSLLDISTSDAPEAEIKALQEKYEAEKTAYELAMKEREEKPQRYYRRNYNKSLGIIPVGAYLARHSEGDCWIIVCKWELLPEQKIEPRHLGHIMVWAMDAQTAKVIAYATCD